MSKLKSGVKLLGNVALFCASKAVMHLLSDPHWGDAEIEETDRRWESKLSELSLTCNKCSSLAQPIPTTRNRYRCVNATCKRQFSGASHNISSYKDYREICRHRAKMGTFW